MSTRSEEHVPNTFVAVWPITDPGRSMRLLQAEAVLALDDLAVAEQVVLVGPPAFEVRAGLRLDIDAPDGVTYLVARCPGVSVADWYAHSGQWQMPEHTAEAFADELGRLKGVAA